MDSFLTILLARIALFLVVLLCAIYVLKRIVKMPIGKVRDILIKLTASFRRSHKALGVLVIFISLLHGLLSSEAFFALNFGTVSWIALALIGATWCFRARLKTWFYYHRALAVVLLLTLFIHIADIGGFDPNFVEYLSFNDYPNQTSQLDKKPIPNVIDGNSIGTTGFKDGIYTGKATGYRPGLVVQVTISKGAITSVVVTSHNETDPRRYSQAIKQIPDDIIRQQSVNVDTVSRATRTSNGIKSAVNDALKQALH